MNRYTLPVISTLLIALCACQNTAAPEVQPVSSVSSNAPTVIVTPTPSPSPTLDTSALDPLVLQAINDIARIDRDFKVASIQESGAEVVYPAKWVNYSTQKNLIALSSNLAASRGRWEETQAFNVSITPRHPFTESVESYMQAILYEIFGGCGKNNKASGVELEETGSLQIAYGDCTFMAKDGETPFRIWLHAIVTNGKTALVYIADVSPESVEAYRRPFREIVRRTRFSR